ncbi:MAG: hypothetical protein KKF46_02865 [Nanoarchaeota archaeon]|nr:hypothetical protein [Nanoarchaeota archaeon]MBU1321274.1 hypothetical protein [Nanoarchaeota archaeon]MBU1597104.1 hypothetical protein [Nanoarchaeota archaeon]MBU2442153.1 hypothetical protein [Nanoarchaeota archaeon]
MAEQEQEEKEKDELGIQKLAEEISETNRKIDDAYDEKLRRLEAKKNLIPDEKTEDEYNYRIAELKEKLSEVKHQISEARKSGKDPLIADLVLRNVNAKIQMAEVTHDKNDFEAVENVLNKAELELKEALKQEEVNIKKEIEERLVAEYTKAK